ncbi:MAG: helix-turn-helix domain-containing protein [Paracoccaceae bacterium]
MSSVDRFVGKRIRQHRVIRGLQQEDLAQALGISAQLVQAYEAGSARISAARLFDIARILNVQIAALYAGIAQYGGPDGSDAPEQLPPSNGPHPMLRHLDQLAPSHRDAILNMVRAILAPYDGPDPSCGATRPETIPKGTQEG